MDQPREWTSIERRSARRDLAELGELADLTRAEEPKRRRLRDRLEGEDGVALSPVLGRQSELRNPALLCDDDLRQTALTLEGIEGFLLRAMRLLEQQDLRAGDVEALLREDVDGQLDALGDTLTSLRRSLAVIAAKL